VPPIVRAVAECYPNHRLQAADEDVGPDRHPLPFQANDDESDFILLATAATIVLARLCVTSAIRAGAQERRATAPVRVS
jgi:hypothetical protein